MDHRITLPADCQLSCLPAASPSGAIRFAYHTSGWWQAPVERVMGQIRAVGYDGIDLAPHPAQLPLSSWTPQQAGRLRDAAETFGVTIASLDLGGPRLLGATAHEPSLLSLYPSQREQRLDLLQRGIQFAAELGAPLVTLPCGRQSPDLASSIAKQHFLEGLEQALEVAGSVDIRIAIEPAAGHLIESYTAFIELLQIFGTGGIGLCYNLANAHCRYEDILAVISEEDALCHMRFSDSIDRGHEPLVPGEGQIAFGPIFAELAAADYRGFISIALPEHFTEPEPAAKRALAHLQALLAAGQMLRPEAGHQ